MNAKELTTSLALAIKALNTTHESDRQDAQKEISELGYELHHRSFLIWKQRTRGVSESLHLLAPAHVYREMLIPFNAVRTGLKKLGLDPDAVGFTEGYLFNDLVKDCLANAKDNLEAGRNVSDDKRHLEQMAAKLKEIGFDDEMKELRDINETLVAIEASEIKPLAEYVALVDESLELRKLAEVGTITGKQEQRLVGVSTYIYRNQVMINVLAALPSEKRVAIVGGHSMFEFRQKAIAAASRYTTLAEKAQKEKEAEEERLEQEELELWRKVAQVECRHRYNHENAVLSNDYDPDGHFYAGPEETYWLVFPDHTSHDPGVMAINVGARCLCHYHKLSKERYIPRTYSASVKAS